MNVEIVIGTENIFNAKEIYSMKENCKNEVLQCIRELKFLVRKF